MKTAIFDFDNTLYSGLSRHELSLSMQEFGMLEKGISNELVSLQESYESGDISYSERLEKDSKVFLKYFNGISRVETARYIEQEFDLAEKLADWAPELIEKLKAAGYLTVVISSSWDFILEEAQNILDFDAFFATTFNTLNGNFADSYITLVDSSSKGTHARGLLKEAESSIGIGDSAADFEYLKLVQNPYLFEPDVHTFDLIGKNKFEFLNSGNILKEINKII